MKINNTITITGEIKRNDRGTHEWGDFKITSDKPLSNDVVSRIASSHGFGGQQFSFSETTSQIHPFLAEPGYPNATYTYDGSFDCWSD